jgi:pilus assembly protein CpaC
MVGLPIGALLVKLLCCGEAKTFPGIRGFGEYVMKVLRIVCVAATVVATAFSGAPAGAQDAVLRVARGAAAQDVGVDVNRAVVLEAIQPFAEVSVANPGIADVAALSNTSIYILGKRPGRTTLTLLGEGGRLIANVSIQVGPDLAELKDRFSEILPGEKIEVRTANDGLVLSGTVSSAPRVVRALELAERYAPGRITNMMTVGGTQQVMLKVRFAEVQRNASKQLGFNWAFGIGDPMGGTSSYYGSGASGEYLNPGNGIPVAPNYNIATAPSTTAYTSAAGPRSLLNIGYAAGGFTAELTIDALEGKGLARTLAEPNLVALSGDAASFLAGGEYPIPIRDSNGGVAVEYRSFGVNLGFTPTVLDDDMINLQIAAESSAIDSSVVVQASGFSFNGFSVRRANTTVELRDGQSFAIAGLLQDDFRDNASQIPWVGDIPVLGALFRSSDFRSSQTELVIIVTVHLVSPTDGDALSLPTDRIRPPSEAELFLLGNLVGSGPVSDVAAQNFQGAYGYVME